MGNAFHKEVEVVLGASLPRPWRRLAALAGGLSVFQFRHPTTRLRLDLLCTIWCQEIALHGLSPAAVAGGAAARGIHLFAFAASIS